MSISGNLKWQLVIAVSIVLGIGLSALGAAIAREQESSKDELEATIAALQTQVAEMDSTPVIETVGTTSAVETAAAWNTETVGGNGFEVLTPAPLGEVAVIARGEYDGSRLPFVVHNNSDAAIENAAIEATVLDASGKLFAVGGDHGIGPGWIEPGNVALGYIYFDGIEIPSAYTIELSLSYDTSESRDPFNTFGIEVVEWDQVEDRIVGFLGNPYSTAITHVNEVKAVCLNADGSIDSYLRSIPESTSIPVGGAIPFQLTLESANCPHIIIVADGFDF